MTRTRTVGLVLATAAALLWLLFLVVALSGDPDDGANIGAGLVLLLALPVSVAASVTLLIGLRAAVRAPGPRTADRAAAVLAVVSVGCLGAFLVLDPYADSDVPRRVALGVGIGAFLLSSGIVAARRPRVRRRPVDPGPLEGAAVERAAEP